MLLIGFCITVLMSKLEYKHVLAQPKTNRYIGGGHTTEGHTTFKTPVLPVGLLLLLFFVYFL